MLKKAKQKVKEMKTNENVEDFTFGGKLKF